MGLRRDPAFAARPNIFERNPRPILSAAQTDPGYSLARFWLARTPFSIILAPEAVSDLRRLSVADRALVLSTLDTHLRPEPTKVSRSRIKKLRGLSHPQYCLRVDDIRIFYDVTDQAVEILAIVAKSEADIWLAQFGEPE